jgi:hypothetical protein
MNRPIDPDLDDIPKVHRMDAETLRINLHNASRELAEERTENRKLRKQVEICTLNQNSFYRYFTGHATGEDMERVKKFYEDRHARMIGYLDEAHSALRELHDAMVRYEADVDGEAPSEHHRMMRRVRNVLGQCKNCAGLEHCGSEFCTDKRHQS